MTAVEKTILSFFKYLKLFALTVIYTVTDSRHLFGEGATTESKKRSPVLSPWTFLFSCMVAYAIISNSFAHNDGQKILSKLESNLSGFNFFQHVFLLLPIFLAFYLIIWLYPRLIKMDIRLRVVFTKGCCFWCGTAILFESGRLLAGSLVYQQWVLAGKSLQDYNLLFNIISRILDVIAFVVPLIALMKLAKKARSLFFRFLAIPFLSLWSAYLFVGGWIAISKLLSVSAAESTPVIATKIDSIGHSMATVYYKSIADSLPRRVMLNGYFYIYNPTEREIFLVEDHTYLIPDTFRIKGWRWASGGNKIYLQNLIINDSIKLGVGYSIRSNQLVKISYQMTFGLRQDDSPDEYNFYYLNGLISFSYLDRGRLSSKETRVLFDPRIAN